MIEILLFITLCLAWQTLKNAIRGPKIPTVSLKSPEVVKARCGCLVTLVGLRTGRGDIVQSCAAHKLMAESLGPR